MFVLLINDSNSSGHILSKPGPSISENGPSISEKCLDPRKTANFGGKKLFLVSEKNFPVRKWVCHVLFAKKMEKFRQIWPQQPLKHFTAAYRGSPPCTQSQHPINRETGNSNVLSMLAIQFKGELDKAFVTSCDSQHNLNTLWHDKYGKLLRDHIQNQNVCFFIKGLGCNRKAKKEKVLLFRFG